MQNLRFKMQFELGNKEDCLRKIFLLKINKMILNKLQNNINNYILKKFDSGNFQYFISRDFKNGF